MVLHTPFDELERHLRLNEQCNHRLLIERQTPTPLLKEISTCNDYIAYPAPYPYAAMGDAQLGPAV